MSDDDDDDWFESAVGDDQDQDSPEDDADQSAEGGSGEPLDSDGASELAGQDAGTDAGHDDSGGDGESPFGADDSDESPFGGGETEGQFGGGGSESQFGGEQGEGQFGGSDSGDSPFGNGRSEDDSPFGGGGSGDSPFGGSGGGGTDDEGDELFDDDFADAFGGGGPGGGDGDEFADDDLETDIPRIKLGIQGLDDMIQGGVPERHLIVTIGGAGSGKTTFGLQFLHHGLQKDDPEKAVFITLEQSKEDILATAAERGWEFERYEDEDLLAVVDLDPVEMANSLQNIRGELPDLIRQFGADRLVLDSVSLLEMMYQDQSKRRTEVFDFTRSLKRAGVTTMLTSEASEGDNFSSRHGIIEYLTDAVIFLRYVRQDTRETRLAVEIQKIRNANHSRETKPYEITGDGISVYQQANIF